MKKHITAVLLSLCLLLAASLPALAAGGTPEGFTEIRDRAGLEAIAEDPMGSYILKADIDLGDAPWAPIAFSGVLEGDGHTLYNLSIREVDPQTAVSVDGNKKPYDTYFAALFSRTQNAAIRNLHLLGVDVDVTSAENCFAAGLVGSAEATEITGCSVDGRVTLNVGGKMCGMAGLVGFGYGTVTNSEVNTTLVLVDTNQAEKCEEFLGGVMATGYMDIENCAVKVRGYASVYGYVHNGGVAGMYFVHTDDTGHRGYIRNCTADAEIHFFEANPDRRAYCDPILGEQLNWSMTLENNETVYFVNGETRDYSQTLLPEMCEEPAYTDAATPPSCEGFGYTTHTCGGCGYSYNTDYLPPAHEPGEWAVTLAATAGQPGTRALFCNLCGQQLEEQSFQALSAISLSQTSLRLKPGESARLEISAEPGDAAGDVVYTSSDEAVATVDATGNVTALAPGTADITCASPDGGVSAVCALTVSAAAAFPLWLVLLIAAIVVLAVVILLLANANRRKKRRAAARRRSQNRQIYSRK